MQMKLSTYNVNGINGRLPVLIRWLEESRPDVVCLQELKSPDEKFPESAIRDAGYGAIWHGQKSWNGVAILARGAKPTELPVQFPTKIEMVVNLKTAKALGLTVPHSILLRADVVIE